MASDYVEEKHLLLSGPNVCSYLRLIFVSPSLVSFFVFGGQCPVNASTRWSRRQVSVFLYIFAKTILIFVAGAINYGERIRALYLASLENLKKNIIKTEKRLGNNIPERIIKWLIIDAVPDLEECNKARDLPTT
ncbi:hypothetical protein MLD38_037027 [Melastoma candidum]|uniref:Uncharacterized protein n=1 Tax=Melastoma candidum TaxID=119954 RepID=A0ACB9LLX2_9MYRT|nr:hypothetical protein MLD38_037027 [Melastoma candidum]